MCVVSFIIILDFTKTLVLCLPSTLLSFRTDLGALDAGEAWTCSRRAQRSTLGHSERPPVLPPTLWGRCVRAGALERTAPRASGECGSGPRRRGAGPEAGVSQVISLWRRLRGNWHQTLFLSGPVGTIQDKRDTEAQGPPSSELGAGSRGRGACRPVVGCRAPTGRCLTRETLTVSGHQCGRRGDCSGGKWAEPWTWAWETPEESAPCWAGGTPEESAPSGVGGPLKSQHSAGLGDL